MLYFHGYTPSLWLERYLYVILVYLKKSGFLYFSLGEVLFGVVGVNAGSSEHE